MILTGHHRFEAGGLRYGGDVGGIGGDGDPADAGKRRAPRHMHDHRLAADVGKRFSGQACRGHPGRNDHKRLVLIPGHGGSDSW